MSKKRILTLCILIVVLILIGWAVYFQIFKLCGNCGQPPNSNIAVNLQLDNNDNGKTFTLVQGKTATVVLNNTYWTFQPVSDTAILQQLQEHVYQPESGGSTILGTGAGTVTAEFQGLASGTAVISATRKLCGEDLPCPEDQKNFSVTIKVVTSLTTDGDYRNYTLVYSTSNGSLPPPYHKTLVLTVSQDAGGVIKGVFEEKDYTSVLATYDLSVSNERLTTLMSAGLTVDPNQADDLTGCTGGSSKSLTISQNGKTILETYSESCANRISNPSLEQFADTVGGMFSEF